MTVKFGKLGKLPARHDPRTLQLSKYAGALAPPAASVDWQSRVAVWPMMENNVLNDCTCACGGHMIEQWTTYVGAPFTPSDAQVVASYSDVSGYDPVADTGDTGAVILDVLNYWRQTGIGGHQIQAFATLDWTNQIEVQDAVAWFGNSYIGLQLPVSAQAQSVWAVPPGGAAGTGAPGSWGLHAVPVVAYDARTLTVVTWGALQQLSWGFLDAYCDEAYAVLSMDWINNVSGLAASGFNLAALNADLKKITA